MFCSNALFEYGAQVPADKIGFSKNGGLFSLLQLTVMHEVITMVVFITFTPVFFKNETLRPT